MIITSTVPDAICGLTGATYANWVEFETDDEAFAYQQELGIVNQRNKNAPLFVAGVTYIQLKYVDSAVLHGHAKPLHGHSMPTSNKPTRIVVVTVESIFSWLLQETEGYQNAMRICLDKIGTLHSATDFTIGSNVSFNRGDVIVRKDM